MNLEDRFNFEFEKEIIIEEENRLAITEKAVLNEGSEIFSKINGLTSLKKKKQYWITVGHLSALLSTLGLSGIYHHQNISTIPYILSASAAIIGTSLTFVSYFSFIKNEKKIFLLDFEYFSNSDQDRVQEKNDRVSRRLKFKKYEIEFFSEN